MIGVPQLGDLFHTGVVVRDLEVGMSELAGAVGASWRIPLSATRRIWTPAGEREHHVEAVYSRAGPPYVELVLAIDDTIWERAGVHHLGFWSDDVERGAQSLEDAGMERVIASYAPDTGALLATYHRSPSGTYIELIASSSRERLVGGR